MMYPLVAATSPEGPIECIETLGGDQAAMELLEDGQIIDEEMILGEGMAEFGRGEDALRGALAKRDVQLERRVRKNKAVDEGRRHGDGERRTDDTVGVSDGADTHHMGAEEGG